MTDRREPCRDDTISDGRRCLLGDRRSTRPTASAEGYEVGLTARRLDRLEAIGEELPTQADVARMDVTEPESARDTFDELAAAMDGVDLVVISAGVGFDNRDLEWEPERDTVDTNVRGFVAIATAATSHFEERGSGHLVGISSVGAHVGNGVVAAYNASKAFVSTYLDGLRYRTGHVDADVDVTTIEPGYVDTELAGGRSGCARRRRPPTRSSRPSGRRRHAPT